MSKNYFKLINNQKKDIIIIIMNLNQKLTINSIIQIGGKIIFAFLGLITVSLITRYLGVEKYGWYTTSLSFLQTVGIIADLGLIPVTAQMLSEPNIDNKDLLNNLFSFRLFSSLLFFLPAPFLALLLPYNLEIKVAIFILSLTFISINLNQVLIGFLQYKLKIHFYSLSEFIQRLFFLILILILIYKQQNFYFLVSFTSLAQILGTTFLWRQVNKIQKIKLKINKHIWLKIIKKSWPIAVSIIFNVIYLRGDIIILSLSSNQIQVGLYGLSYKLIDLANQIAMIIMGLMLPTLTYYWSRKKYQDFNYYLTTSLKLMLILSLPIIIWVFFNSNKIINLIGGQNFHSAKHILQILIISLLGAYIGSVFGHIAVAINKQKQTIWIYVSNAILTLTGYLIFIPKYGALGAAWLTVFSELYTGLLLGLFLNFKYLHLKIKLKKFFKIILINSLILIYFYYTSQFNLILSSIIGFGIYSILIKLSKIIDLKRITNYAQ